MPSPKVFLGFCYYLPAVHRGVIRRARESGWDLLTNANDLVVPSGESFDGIILQYGVLPELDAMANALPGRVVDITRRIPSSKLNRVYPDGVVAGMLAAEHLMTTGHRQFVAVRGQHWGDDAKCKGFLDTLAPAGFTAEVWVLGEENLPGADEAILREKLSMLKGSIAIFCLHDSHGHQLLRIARELGLIVPSRLSILGCGNDELLCEASMPGLSSVDLNLDSVGYEAARRLDELMHGDAPDVCERAVPSNRIFERMSTGESCPSGEIARRAFSLLKTWQGGEPSVDELARLVGVNRRALEREFRTDLGCGPLEYMIRRRVERAAGFMRENPSMSGPAVAERLGYESVAHFYRQFSKIKGMTVGEFRRRFGAPRR